MNINNIKVARTKKRCPVESFESLGWISPQKRLPEFIRSYESNGHKIRHSNQVFIYFELWKSVSEGLLIEQDGKIVGWQEVIEPGFRMGRRLPMGKYPTTNIVDWWMSGLSEPKLPPEPQQKD